MRVVLSILALLVFAPCVLACPYCADTIQNTDAAASASALGGAMNLSIYCMFMGLFVAFGIVARAVMKGIRS